MAEKELPKPSRDEIDALAVGVDFGGLQVLPNGEFRHSGLIPGWTVEGVAHVGDGGLALTWLAIRPQAGTGVRVTSRLLRSIPVAVLLNEIRQRMLYLDSGRRFLYQRAGHEADWTPANVGGRTGSAGHARRLDDHRKQALLRQLAIAYLDEMGQPGVYGRLVRRFRRRQLSVDEVKALVRAARADGWLSAAAAHGQRGAEPGPRLLQDQEFQQKGEK